MESRKRKRAAFSTTQKPGVLRYQDLHSRASRQALADHFVVLREDVMLNVELLVTFFNEGKSLFL